MDMDSIFMNDKIISIEAAENVRVVLLELISFNVNYEIGTVSAGKIS